ncbi:MAG: TIGR03032 family protein [Saprospiraceae bacterium]|nr:TIGR03032 family protein [Saprospiraceae bacterium]
MVNQPPPPFSCTYSPNIPELIAQLNCTLVISTYQAGKVIFISAKDDESLVQLPRTFDRAMGIAVDGDRMAIATKDEVIVLANAPGLAKNYPKNPGVYDAMFMPRLTYFTGQVDMHDLHFGQDGLWAVNTSFSCLALISEAYSWIPRWQPDFITGLHSEDRCHLNGLAMVDGRPRYVTSLGTGNELQSWRKTLPQGGTLIDVETNQHILSDLPMPHSPRIYDGHLYLLLSATGSLVRVDIANSTFEEIRKLDGFVRGMTRMGDYIFVALSKLRQNSSTFKDLEIAKKATSAGIAIIHLKSGALVGEIKFLASVDEIYDLQILPGMRRPGILNTKNPVHKYGLSIPNATYWARDEMKK